MCMKCTVRRIRRIYTQLIIYNTYTPKHTLKHTHTQTL